MPKSLNSGERAASASASPISCSLPRNISTPSLVLRFSVSVNFSTSSPTVFASSCGFWNNIIISLDKALADISTFWPLASSVAAKASISGIVILACAPTPAMRWAKLTRYGFAAVQFCERTFTVEPTASIASLVPSICSTPKMLVSLAMTWVAPSPKSTSATLMMSAAST